MNTKTLSFFQDTSKTIDFNFFKVELKTLLIISSVIIAFTTFFILFNAINQMLIEKRVKRKNIKTNNKKK